MSLALLTGSWHSLAVPRATRRITVLVAALAYPVLLLAWIGLRDVHVHPLVWAGAVIGALGVLAAAARGLYTWQHALANQPDETLDERQVAIRDRAYLVAYRLFVAGVTLTLLVLGIGADILDPVITLTFDTVQPFFWAATYYAFLLPSAAVAWSMPEPPADDDPPVPAREANSRSATV